MAGKSWKWPPISSPEDGGTAKKSIEGHVRTLFDLRDEKLEWNKSRRLRAINNPQKLSYMQKIVAKRRGGRK